MPLLVITKRAMIIHIKTMIVIISNIDHTHNKHKYKNIRNYGNSNGNSSSYRNGTSGSDVIVLGVILAILTKLL